MFSIFTRKSNPETQARAINCTDNAEVETRALTLEDLFGTPSVSSGVSVGPSSATRVPAVRRAVEALAEGVSGLPCVLYETAASGAVTAITGHPLADLLTFDANPWTPASRFFEQLTRDAVLTGNGHAWITRDGSGTIRELVRLRPGDISIDEDPTNPLAAPLYRLQGREVAAADILHIRAPSLDGIRGQSPVTACREAIGVLIAIEAHVARLFGRGARPSGILTTTAKLGAEAAKRMAASWRSAHGGANSGGVAVLEEGLDFKTISMNSVDAQLLELWQFAVDEVARIFGVPPHLVFDLGRATWGNAAEMGASFLRFGLSRWLREWEGELNAKLIATEDRRRLSIEFDTDALTRTDLAARSTAYSTLISARVMTPNEARAREGLPPKPGGDELANPYTTTGKTIATKPEVPANA